MNEIETRCECCGASKKSYWHSLSNGLVSSLILFAKAVKRKGVNRIHLSKELSLTKNQYNNFQKLGKFGLVAKSGDSGSWVLTRRGLGFLQGDCVQKKVLTFRGKVQDWSVEQCTINDFPNSAEWYEKEFDFEIYLGKVV